MQSTTSPTLTMTSPLKYLPWYLHHLPYSTENI